MDLLWTRQHNDLEERCGDRRHGLRIIKDVFDLPSTVRIVVKELPEDYLLTLWITLLVAVSQHKPEAVQRTRVKKSSRFAFSTIPYRWCNANFDSTPR